MIFWKLGGRGQGPFGTFPKIQPFWRRHPSLCRVMYCEASELYPTLNDFVVRVFFVFNFSGKEKVGQWKKNMRPVVFCVFHLLWTLRSYSLKELLQGAFVGQWIDFWRATFMIINNFIHGCTVVPAAFCKQLFFETSVTLYYTLSVCHSPLQFMNRQKPSGSVLESGNKLKV